MFLTRMGTKSKIVVTGVVDGQGYFKGRLAGIDGEAVVIDDEDGRSHRVPLALIKRANLEVEF